MRAFQEQHQDSRESKFIEWFVRLPGFVRRLFLWALFKNPQRIKDFYGTVLVTSLECLEQGVDGEFRCPITPSNSPWVALVKSRGWLIIVSKCAST